MIPDTLNPQLSFSCAITEQAKIKAMSFGRLATTFHFNEKSGVRRQ